MRWFLCTIFRSVYCSTWIFHLRCCNQYRLLGVWHCCHCHHCSHYPVAHKVQTAIQGEVWAPVFHSLIGKRVNYTVKVNHEYDVRGSLKTQTGSAVALLIKISLWPEITWRFSGSYILLIHDIETKQALYLCGFMHNGLKKVIMDIVFAAKYKIDPWFRYLLFTRLL